MRASFHRVRPVLASVVAFAAAVGLAGCGAPSGAVDLSGVIPGLPGDGAVNTVRPGAVTPPPPPAGSVGAATPPGDDPWSGRTDLISAPAPAAPAPMSVPAIERFTLPNGLVVAVVARSGAPVVDVQLMVQAGRNDVSREHMGLANFVASMLSKGTRTRDANALAASIDAVGGALTINPGFDATLLACKVLAAHQNTCLRLIADIVANPAFPAAAVDQVRAELLASVHQRSNDPGALAAAHFQNLFWGDQHARGWIMSQRSIETIQRADLVRWHQTWFVPQNAVLVLVGDVNPRGLRFRLEQAFRGWRGGAAPAHAEHARASAGARVRLVDLPGTPRTHIVTGHLGLSPADSNYFDALVANEVLGGARGARLQARVRGEIGADAGASSRFERNRTRGAFVVTAETPSSAALATLAVIQRELGRIKEAGPDPAEVAAAAGYLAGQYATRFQTGSDVAGAVLAAALYGFDDAYIRDYPVRVGQVSAASAAQAAAQRFTPDELMAVLVGDAKTLEPQLRKAGVRYDKVSHMAPIAGYERTQEGDGAASAPSPEAEKAGQALLAKAVAAKGGAARLRAIRSLRFKASATIRSGGQEVAAQLERLYLAPDKLRIDLDLSIPGAATKVVTVLNGDQAWSQQPGRLDEFPAEGVTELKKQLWRDPDLILARARDSGSRVSAGGRQRLDETTYELLRVIRADGTSADVYLDPKTHLIRAIVYTDMGTRAVERFDDYRAVAGVQVAHRRSTDSTDTKLEVQLTEIAINPSLPVDAFAKP
ncbi:insulinase family protein [Haliangium sp.]|uniref:M16 family metallopeptidase n=1 Tax=Haliangium sp. TaxID=2663208 RepID=UPI003D1317FC